MPRRRTPSRMPQLERVCDVASQDVPISVDAQWQTQSSRAFTGNPQPFSRTRHRRRQKLWRALTRPASSRKALGGTFFRFSRWSTVGRCLEASLLSCDTAHSLPYLTEIGSFPVLSMVFGSTSLGTLQCKCMCKGRHPFPATPHENLGPP